MHLQFVIAVDDEDRENEGDLIMAASLVTPEAMAFIVRHGTGIVCVAMKEEDLKRLQLPLMVPDKENEEKLLTAFTISVVCSGIFLILFLWHITVSLMLFSNLKKR
jgi:3,4-dihydroxy 2-butanone 4-phosphate synthase/GTP cyclohydrolase II